MSPRAKPEPVHTATWPPRVRERAARLSRLETAEMKARVERDYFRAADLRVLISRASRDLEEALAEALAAEGLTGGE